MDVMARKKHSQDPFIVEGWQTLAFGDFSVGTMETLCQTGDGCGREEGVKSP